jgi:ubiquinone/menaquinone biosynthesis C-methylase UbiE
MVHRHSDQHFDRRRSVSYDRLSRWTLRGLYHRVARDVAAVAAPGGLVVDVGTGPGRLLHVLAGRRTDLRLAGMDVSADMIEVGQGVAREHGLERRISLQVADVSALPYRDGEVDLLVSTLSMHHWPDLDAAAGELGRVLRPGGRLLLYDFRFAPIAEVTEALRTQPAFAHCAVRRVSVWSGLLPLLARLDVTAKPSA